MKTTSTNEKLTIQAAARMLGVSRGTVIQYLDDGRLTRIKDTAGIYIPLEEIRGLSGNQDKRHVISPPAPSPESQRRMVTIEREHYEALLTQLANLEVEKRHLIGYKEDMIELKGALSRKEAELEEVRAKLLMTEELLYRIRKMGLWKRLFGWGGGNLVGDTKTNK